MPKRPQTLPLPRVRSAIVDRFVAGDSIALLGWDYEVAHRVVEACLRERLKRKRGKR